MSCEFCHSQVHIWFDCPKKPDGWKPDRLRKAKATETMGGLPVPAASVKAERTGRRPTKARRVGMNAGPDQGATAGETATKFDKKAWMRDYMREHRKGLRRRKAAEKEAGK